MLALVSRIVEETTGADDKAPAFEWGNFDAYVNKAAELFDAHGLNVVKAIAIYVIGKMVLKIALGIIGKLMSKKGLDETLRNFLGNILHIAGMAMIVITALAPLGVDTTTFAAVLGAAVFAIGFALQDSLSNFASGVMIILFKPFKIGDFVEAGGTAGVIVEISVFCTILKTGDNKKVIVPNSGMTGGTIINYSANPTRRVDLVFGISYDDDMAKAKQIMTNVMAKDSRILAEPAPTIGLSELGDNSVNFVCRPWVNSADYWGVLFDLNENMKTAFDAEGISFPYPQRDVHMLEGN
ncbi:MAG: small conductance mechanosensitive channel [Planctomycetota bacterium]|jgi:small conductance mechanosensitive channel